MAKKQPLYVALTSLSFATPRGDRVDCREGAKLSDAEICAEDLASFVERGLLGGTGLAPKSEPPPDPEEEDPSDPPQDEEPSDDESSGEAPEPPSTRPDAPKRRGRKPKSEPPPDPEA